MPRVNAGIYCRGVATGAVTNIVGAINAATNKLLFSVGGYAAAAAGTDFTVEWGDGTNWQTMTRINTNVLSGQIVSLFELNNPNVAYDRFRVTSARAYSDGGACAWAAYSNAEIALRYSNALNNDTAAATLNDTVSNGAAGDEIYVFALVFGPTLNLTNQSQTLIQPISPTACANYLYGHASKDYAAGLIAEAVGDFPGMAVAVIRDAPSGTTITPPAISAVAVTVDPATILGSVSVTPPQILSVAVTIDPTINITGTQVITPPAISAVALTVNPSLVITGGQVAFTALRNQAGAVITGIVQFRWYPDSQGSGSQVPGNLNAPVETGSFSATAGAGAMTSNNAGLGWLELFYNNGTLWEAHAGRYTVS